MSLDSWSQAYILEAYNAIPNSSLPYTASRQDMIAQDAGYGFAYWGWPKGTLNDNVWTDLVLSTLQAKDPIEGWPESFLRRTFTPTNGSYKLCCVEIGCRDYGKTILISINSKGNYIDAIDVAATMMMSTGTQLFPMQWSISSDIKVTVYQLKLTSSTPSMFDSNITFPLQAQRIDRVYQISATGKFSLISTKLYKPQSYFIGIFSALTYQIFQGTETPITTTADTTTYRDLEGILDYKIIKET